MTLAELLTDDKKKQQQKQPDENKPSVWDILFGAGLVYPGIHKFESDIISDPAYRSLIESRNTLKERIDKFSQKGISFDAENSQMNKNLSSIDNKIKSYMWDKFALKMEEPKVPIYHVVNAYNNRPDPIGDMRRALAKDGYVDLAVSSVEPVNRWGILMNFHGKGRWFTPTDSYSNNQGLRKPSDILPDGEEEKTTIPVSKKIYKDNKFNNNLEGELSWRFTDSKDIDWLEDIYKAQSKMKKQVNLLDNLVYELNFDPEYLPSNHSAFLKEYRERKGADHPMTKTLENKAIKNLKALEDSLLPVEPNDMHPDIEIRNKLAKDLIFQKDLDKAARIYSEFVPSANNNELRARLKDVIVNLENRINILDGYQDTKNIPLPEYSGEDIKPWGNTEPPDYINKSNYPVTKLIKEGNFSGSNINQLKPFNAILKTLGSMPVQTGLQLAPALAQLIKGNNLNDWAKEQILGAELARQESMKRQGYKYNNIVDEVTEPVYSDWSFGRNDLINKLVQDIKSKQTNHKRRK